MGAPPGRPHGHSIVPATGSCAPGAAEPPARASKRCWSGAGSFARVLPEGKFFPGSVHAMKGFFFPPPLYPDTFLTGSAK